jgi:hypothetical protein
VSDDTLDLDWITAFARTEGLEPPDPALVEALLDLAGRAAHGSGDRRNAPLSCFLAGLRLGRDGTAATPEVIGKM